MTESDWLTAGDPRTMLEHLEPVPSDRKLRLWCAALAKGRLNDHEYTRGYSEWAWGRKDNQEVLDFPNVMTQFWRGPRQSDPSQQVKADLLRDIVGNPFRPWLCCICARGSARLCHDAKGFSVYCSIHATSFDDQAVLPAHILEMAQHAYSSADFRGLPILADALEEAGCYFIEILEHLRSGEKHVRGCWVIDLILGKK